MDPATIGAVVSAGASLVGKLFGGKEEKQENTIDYVKMVKWAEKAGFNPLTALRAGGGAGFTTTTSHPALSAWTGIADAVGTFAANYDPQANERAALEDDIQRARLENIQADTKQRMRSMEVPVKSGATSVDWTGIPVRSAAAQPGTVTGAPQVPELGDATVSNPWERAHVDPKTKDAAVSENRYGEIVGGAIGAYVLGKDWLHNMTRDPSRPWRNDPSEPEWSKKARKKAEKEGSWFQIHQRAPKPATSSGW